MKISIQYLLDSENFGGSVSINSRGASVNKIELASKFSSLRIEANGEALANELLRLLQDVINTASIKTKGGQENE